MKAIFNFIFVSVFIYGAYLGWSFWKFQFAPLQPEKSNDVVLVDVRPGSHLTQVMRELAAQGADYSPLILKVYLRFSSASQRPLRPGEYELPWQLSAADLINTLLTQAPLQHRFTHPEGRNLYDLEAVFRADSRLREVDWWKWFRDPELLKLAGFPQGHTHPDPRLEGFLYPETYAFQKYDTPVIILRSMISQYKKNIEPLLNQHPWGQTAIGRYRLLTLASVIEKETGLRDEQHLIASVFWNRLRLKMKLQSDPTTIYGLLPQFDGNLRRIHLTTPHAYNTYTLPELPIGPICNPGVQAITALLNPTESNYLYFVSRGDGSHMFSTNLKDHNAAVRRFQLKK